VPFKPAKTWALAPLDQTAYPENHL
jgi:hypothetical protein